MKTEKQVLQEKLNAIVEKENHDNAVKHLPIFKKKFEGKYFKCMNSYSSGKRWPVYIKVESIKLAYIYDTRGNGITSAYDGWSFQTDCYGEIFIKKERQNYIHSIGKQISKKEFMAAYNKMKKSLPKV